MPDLQTFAIALGGVAFGWFVWLTWRMQTRALVLLLFYLYVFQTLLNQAAHWFSGTGAVEVHILGITELRLVFAIPAVLTLWALHRWRSKP